MAKGEVFDALKEVLVDRLKVKEPLVRPEAAFFEDLGLDSIDLTTAVMAVEERFGIEVSDKELERISTIGEAVELLSEKVSVGA